MKHLLFHFLGSVAAVLVAAQVIPGFYISTFVTAVVVTALLWVISITIKPVLLLLTLPINLLTLGLFTFVINAGILLGLAQFIEGFSITGFMPALLGAVVIAVFQWLIHRFI